jgi:hypothetical protein
MANDLSNTINFLVPIILIIIAIVFIWWKFSDPLIKFGILIKGLFNSGKQKSFEKINLPREIVYDI